MLERIRSIANESAELQVDILNSDFNVDGAIRWLSAALDDLEASEHPSDEQVKEIFSALANLKNKLAACLAGTDRQHHSLVENLTDRIDIFLFHHRL